MRVTPWDSPGKFFIISILMEGDSYGYEINKKIKERSRGLIEMQYGTLYPLLREIENNLLTKSYLDRSNKRRERRYFQLTQKGIDYYKKQKRVMEGTYTFLKSTFEDNTGL
jgi:DNA-binding PadR family transcriptional regulator